MEDMCTSRFAWLLQISSATRTLAAQLCSLNSDPSQDPELALERAMHLMFDLVSNQMHALGAQENSIVRLGSRLNWQDDRFDTDSTPQHGPHLVEHGALPLGPSKSFPEVYEFDGRPPVDDALRHSRYALIAGMKVVIYQIADKYESVQNALKKLWWHLMGEMTTNHYLITWHDGFVIAQAWEHLGFGKQFCFLENFEVHHYAIFRWQQTAALACVKEPSVRQTDSYLTDCCQEMRCSGFTRFWRTGVLGLENDHFLRTFWRLEDVFSNHVVNLVDDEQRENISEYYDEITAREYLSHNDCPICYDLYQTRAEIRAHEDQSAPNTVDEAHEVGPAHDLRPLRL
jgi:hypothetical protein